MSIDSLAVQLAYSWPLGSGSAAARTTGDVITGSLGAVARDPGVLAVGAVCPVAPGNAQQYVDEITGYILWGVLALFTIGLIIGIGSVLAGRIFGMPHASKAGVVSIVIIFVAGIGYLVLPGMVDGFMGTGCIAAPTPADLTLAQTQLVAPADPATQPVRAAGQDLQR